MMRPIVFAIGLGLGAGSYLCIYVAKKVNRTAQQLLLESRQNSAKLDVLVSIVEQLSEEVSTLNARLNVCESDVICTGTGNVPSASKELKGSSKLEVGNWTCDQVQQYIRNALSSSSYKLSKEDIEHTAAAFQKVDGASLEDLVYDNSHGIGLEQKLSFMGLSNDLVAIIATELHNLCPQSL